MAQELGSISLRRTRQNRWIRDLVEEVTLSPKRLIQPLFVVEGISKKEAVPGLPGVFRETQDSLLEQIHHDMEKGVRKFILFGVPGSKKSKGFRHDFTSKAIQSIKKNFGEDLFLFVDVCLCSHTESGHCGIINHEGDHLINSETVESLALAALEYAQAGANGVAPSDMMDGRIAAIRETLNRNEFDRTLLLSYSAKFHSKFYGPFREAANSAPSKKGDTLLNDRATYQINPANLSDAIRSSVRDWQEGADLLMVKPGLPYLDVIAKLRSEIPDAPVFAYEVSGEYAAIEALAEKGLIDARKAHLESWTSLHRAGACSIITYGARNAAEWIRKEEESA